MKTGHISSLGNPINGCKQLNTCADWLCCTVPRFKANFTEVRWSRYQDGIRAGEARCDFVSLSVCECRCCGSDSVPQASLCTEWYQFKAISNVILWEHDRHSAIVLPICSLIVSVPHTSPKCVQIVPKQHLCNFSKPAAQLYRSCLIRVASDRSGCLRPTPSGMGKSAASITGTRLPVVFEKRVSSRNVSAL